MQLKIDRASKIKKKEHRSLRSKPNLPTVFLSKLQKSALNAPHNVCIDQLIGMCNCPVKSVFTAVNQQIFSGIFAKNMLNQL